MFVYHLRLALSGCSCLDIGIMSGRIFAQGWWQHLSSEMISDYLWGTPLDVEANVEMAVQMLS